MTSDSTTEGLAGLSDEDIPLIAHRLRARWVEQHQLSVVEREIFEADMINAADLLSAQSATIAQQRQEIERLQEATFVPGMMRCAKCEFGLTRTNLYVNQGTTGPGDNQTEPCPNGCGPLWPLTWKEYADSTDKALMRFADERDALREQVDKLTAELGDDAWDGRCACRIDPDENEHLCLRHSEMEADNAALREKLRSIELAAEDATEYVLATLLREQKEENATLRTRVEALEAEVESGWTHAKHVAERDALRAQVEALRESLKSEADYCYGWAEHYAATNPERAARHRERGDRLSAVLQGEQDDGL